METKTQKAENTKQGIMSSAYKLFNEKGFEATSVREIVEDAGCAKGTFYLYFETKIALLLEIMNELFKKLYEIIAVELGEVGDDPFNQIERLFNTLVIHMEEKEGHFKLMHTYEMLNLIEEEAISTSFIDGLIYLITQFLTSGIDKGYFRTVDPKIYGRIIFSLGHDMMESAMLIKFPANMQIVKNELMIIIRKILEK